MFHRVLPLILQKTGARVNHYTCIGEGMDSLNAFVLFKDKTPLVEYASEKMKSLSLIVHKLWPRLEA